MSLDLKGYREFQKLRQHEIRPKDLGLNGRTGDVNRLQARVRMVKSFRSMELKEYNASTAEAYGAMFRAFLAFTCFEAFGYLMDCKPYEFKWKYPDHQYDRDAMIIRAHDPEWKFAEGLIDDLEPGGVRDALIDFTNEDKNNPINFALGIRHTFAHGRLTANVNGADPGSVKVICDELSELLLEIIDEEFYSIVGPRYREVLQGGI